MQPGTASTDLGGTTKWVPIENMLDAGVECLWRLGRRENRVGRDKDFWIQIEQDAVKLRDALGRQLNRADRADGLIVVKCLSHVYERLLCVRVHRFSLRIGELIVLPHTS